MNNAPGRGPLRILDFGFWILDYPKVQTQDPKSKIQNPIEARPFAVVLGVVLALLLVGQQVPAYLDQDLGSSAPLLNVSEIPFVELAGRLTGWPGPRTKSFNPTVIAPTGGATVNLCM